MTRTSFARAVGLALCLAAGAAAAQTPVDLELVMLADATGSIDQAEILFQRQGYADALLDPTLIEQLTGGYHGRVALTYVEWGDHLSQDVVVDWTLIDGAAPAAGFAERLMAAPRRAFGRNAIGAALVLATDMIETNAYDGVRRIIDFSADSANNWNGPSIAEGRDYAVGKGITVNGLAVLCRQADCSGRPVIYDLEEAFEREVVGGDGAFVITADDRASFAAAVREKLFLEFSATTLQERAGAE